MIRFILQAYRCLVWPIQIPQSISYLMRAFAAPLAARAPTIGGSCRIAPPGALGTVKMLSGGGTSLTAIASALLTLVCSTSALDTGIEVAGGGKQEAGSRNT